MSDLNQERVGRTFLISGTVGLIAALVTNVVAVMVFQKPSAAFFPQTGGRNGFPPIASGRRSSSSGWRFPPGEVRKSTTGAECR